MVLRSTDSYKATYTANALTDHIVYLICASGGIATRINTVGVYDKKKELYRKSKHIKGVADVLGCYKGLFVAVEIKIGRDKQSPAQKEFEARVVKAGGKYFIATDLDGFTKWFNENFNTKL